MRVSPATRPCHNLVCCHCSFTRACSRRTTADSTIRWSSEMSSERAGLYKTRVENFARHLQNRLRSLGEPVEHSWVEAGPAETEVYYDINSPLVSPQEELAEPIFILDQNQAFPLQRDESNDSQYFDSVDTQAALSTNSTEKKTIPHLKTDETIINGYREVKSGGSRIQKFPSFDLEPHLSEKELIGNSCDEDNVDCVVNGCEVDTRQAEEEKADSDSQFCVFCDIEQIKSSLTSVNDSGKQEESRKSHCREEETKPEVPTTSESNQSDILSESENTVSLSDLLHVLKKEISRESPPTENHIENTDNSQTDCPNIEVQEASPVQIKIKEDIEEEFDIEIKRKNFRRCSSLKSCKTPPSTPGRKKIVRFADVLGLDLADVKTFLDEVPTVPKSAYEDLHGIELSSSPVSDYPLNKITVITSIPDKILIPLFQQPCVQPNFLDRVRQNNICLESAFVSDQALFAVTGLVRVRNIDFHKSVYVRYSIDHWRTYSDLQGRYVPNSCDGFSDKFTFVLYAHTLSIGQKLEFAVRFHAAGSQFWDSNGGMNYMFECGRRRAPDLGVAPSPFLDTSASFY